MKRIFLLINSFLFLIVLACDKINPVMAGTNEKPNIVIILADDLGYGSVGVYGANQNVVQTPSIDRLSSEGRLFTNA
jgi:hypothetical protein